MGVNITGGPVYWNITWEIPDHKIGHRLEVSLTWEDSQVTNYVVCPRNGVADICGPGVHVFSEELNPGVVNVTSHSETFLDITDVTASITYINKETNEIISQYQPDAITLRGGNLTCGCCSDTVSHTLKYDPSRWAVDHIEYGEGIYEPTYPCLCCRKDYNGEWDIIINGYQILRGSSTGGQDSSSDDGRPGAGEARVYLIPYGEYVSVSTGTDESSTCTTSGDRVKLNGSYEPDHKDIQDGQNISLSAEQGCCSKFVRWMRDYDGEGYEQFSSDEEINVSGGPPKEIQLDVGTEDNPEIITCYDKIYVHYKALFRKCLTVGDDVPYDTETGNPIFKRLGSGDRMIYGTAESGCGCDCGSGNDGNEARMLNRLSDVSVDGDEINLRINV